MAAASAAASSPATARQRLTQTASRGQAAGLGDPARAGPRMRGAAGGGAGELCPAERSAATGVHGRAAGATGTGTAAAAEATAEHPPRGGAPQDWAQEVARLLEGRSADCAKITLACDNLNTHTKGAFCAARELVRRVEFGYAPHHGSWLHNLECELSATTRQSVAARRSGELSALQAAIAACSTATNARPRGVEWQRKVADARCKLKSVFPKMIL